MKSTLQAWNLTWSSQELISLHLLFNGYTVETLQLTSVIYGFGCSHFFFFCVQIQLILGMHLDIQMTCFHPSKDLIYFVLIVIKSHLFYPKKIIISQQLKFNGTYKDEFSLHLRDYQGIFPTGLYFPR